MLRAWTAQNSASTNIQDEDKNESVDSAKFTKRQVLFLNNVAFILDSIGPELRSLGFSVRIIGRSPSDPVVARRTFASQTGADLRDLVFSGKVDILHINYALFGLLRFSKPGVPVILHCHGSDVRPSKEFKERIVNLLSKASLPFVDRVWYSTPDLARTLRRTRPDSLYMPSPVQPAFFDVPYTTQHPPRILFAVPMSHLKGADMAIAAMQLLVASNLGLKLSSYGFGPDATEASDLRSKIPHNVRILPWIEHSLMHQFLAGFDVVVGQLYLGFLGITELEAMAAGKPLIIGAGSSLPNREPYYRDDPPLIRARSALEVSDAVSALLESPILREGMGERARQWVARYHSAQVVARMYKDEYELVIG